MQRDVAAISNVKSLTLNSARRHHRSPRFPDRWDCFDDITLALPDFVIAQSHAGYRSLPFISSARRHSILRRKYVGH